MIENLLERGLGLTALAISVASSIYMFITARSRVNAGRIEELEKQVVGLTTKTLALENKLDNMPVKEDVFELKLSISDLNGTMGRLDESLGSVARTVQRIDTYMREERPN